MRRAAIFLILALAGLGSLSSSSCFVSRLSERFTCTVTEDCTDGRTCDQGYCVETPCPSPCTSCNLVDKTCRVECSSNQKCGNVQCPAGFDCTIRCSNGNACQSIDCAPARSCTIDCSGAGSCGSINCGTGACDIDCAGAGACPSIDCVGSCRCDVSCNNTPACPSIACPHPVDTFCTQGGVPGERCDSQESILCDTCL